MKAIVFLFAAVLTLACCKSKEKLMTQDALTQQPVEVVVKEDIQDTLTITTPPATVKKEEVKFTQGAEIMRYCVIVGSFIHEQNAIRLHEKLIDMGFSKSSIMQNKEGMYRVSILCNHGLDFTQSKLADIRRMYPQFSDAWLLQVKD